MLKLDMFDIITFGSATCDIFLKLPRPETESGKICFPLGDKVEVGDWAMHSGGGGTNTAYTFALQGLKAAYYGQVGDDYFGQMVMNDLEKAGVSLKLVKKSSDKATALSVILSPSVADRAILVAPGACHFLSPEKMDWPKIKKASWFYIAPFYEKSADNLPVLVDFAQKNKIKIALNPSAAQIRNQPEALKKIIGQVNVLLLNLKEAAILAELSEVQERLLAEKIKSWGPGLVVITKGGKGAIISDGRTYYEAGIFPVKVAERTGAGDAFGSGFVAGLLQKNDIEYAIRLAVANSASCLTQVGAKNGLLKKGDLDDWPALDVRKNL